ncbi:MAG: hypothetical protein O9327_02240 [Polaromonas sp.]|nr:hypothetical protein [Polaromonas sp.]
MPSDPAAQGLARAQSAIASLLPHPGQAEQRGRMERAVHTFLASGLADRNFVDRLAPKQPDGCWSALSEALIFEQLLGFRTPPRRPGHGPDFLVEIQGKRVWIEVVCVTANQVPAAWTQASMSASKSIVQEFPHAECLARWTSAIKEKAGKLSREEGGTPKGYLHDGIVGPGEAYVIAVNGSLLRSAFGPNFTGISGHPYPVEAAFGLGPTAIPIDRQTLKAGAAYQSIRAHFPKASRPDVAIPTQVFLDPAYAGVSAIWGIDWVCDLPAGAEPSAVVHNPGARVRLPMGTLPCEHEYFAAPDGEAAYELRVESGRRALDTSSPAT